MTMTFKEALIAHLQGEKVQVLSRKKAYLLLDTDTEDWRDFSAFFADIPFSAMHSLTGRVTCRFSDIRIAPRTILVNGVEVPAPEKEAPPVGTEYFMPFVTCDELYEDIQWDGDPIDRTWLDLGLVYLDKESAIARAKAMLITQEVK